MADGFRSAGFPLGLSSPVAGPAPAGFRSLLAFWMGGASMPVAAPAEGGGGGGQPRGKQGYSLLPDVYYTNTDEEDIITFIVSWTINHG